jgi:hypothetical protein
MIFIPNLYAFLNGNAYFGNKGDLRFRIRGVIAGAEGEEQHPVLEAWIWYGKNSLDNSNVDDQKDFDLTDEGRTELLAWLDAKYEEYQAQNA